MRAPESASAAAALAPLLSEEERQRAGHLRRDPDRYRYVAARACLRVTLSEILMRAPAEIPIRIGALGAPTLDGPLGGPAFSLSHAGAWVVVAVGGARALGVDVESLPGRNEEAEPGKRSPEPGVRGTSEHDREVLEWVGKEAVLKALGCGLALDPDRIGIALRGDGRFDIRRLPPGILRPSGLFAARVSAPPGYAAALAVIAVEGALELTVTERWRSGADPAFQGLPGRAGA